MGLNKIYRSSQEAVNKGSNYWIPVPNHNHKPSLTPITLPLLLNYGSLPLGGLFKSKSFQAPLYSTKMGNSDKAELKKLPSIKDQKVELWINSDEFFVDILKNINYNIKESTKDFDLEVKDIYIEDAYPYEDEPLDEFVIKVKVSRGTDIHEINKFWNFIGSETTKFFDGNFGSNQNKIDEIDEKLLIIVTEEDNL